MNKQIYRPILFNTDMVRANLEGRKTMTRRPIKLTYSNTHITHSANEKYGCPLIEIQNDVEGETHGTNPDGSGWRKLLWAKEVHPQYHMGDILWVRETWQFAYDLDGNEQTIDGTGRYIYAADGDPGFTDWLDDKSGRLVDHVLWRPSIFMPREAARIFLRVTDVRAERLLTPFFACGDVAIKALAAEGVILPQDCVDCIDNYGCPNCIDTNEDSECGILDDVRNSFADLWDSTIKKADIPTYGWKADPWVWVYTFERVDKPEGWCK